MYEKDVKLTENIKDRIVREGEILEKGLVSDFWQVLKQLIQEEINGAVNALAVPDMDTSRLHFIRGNLNAYRAITAKVEGIVSQRKQILTENTKQGGKTNV